MAKERVTSSVVVKAFLSNLLPCSILIESNVMSLNVQRWPGGILKMPPLNVFIDTHSDQMIIQSFHF